MTTLTQTKMETPPLTPDLSQLVDRVVAHFANPDWLAKARRTAFDTFQNAPLPARVAHLWRYTDPQLFVPRINPDTWLSGAGVDRDTPALLSDAWSRSDLSGAALASDRETTNVLLTDDLAKRGVTILDLHEAAANHADLVQERLGMLVGRDFGKFEALVNALWTSGTLVYVPKNVIVEKPVHLLTTSAADTSFVARRLLVVLEEGAALTLIDEYGENGNPASGAEHVLTVVEQFVGRGAQLTYSPIQNWGKTTTSYLTQRARLDADAKMETVLTSLGSETCKIDCGVELVGKGAESNIHGLAIGTGKQHFDHHTVHQHNAGSTTSDLTFKAALRDKANSIYTGLIGIAAHAPFCEAYQENRNLLLSSGARVETIPELEILTNEVRCSHGATVGKVDPEEIFYLESRCIDPREAIRLIVTGFVGPVVEHLPVIVRTRIHDAVIDRLGEVA